MQRDENRTPPGLLFLIIALVAGVIIADFVTPLGVAVWVFYAFPLVACLFARSPMLPLYVSAAATISIALSLVLDPISEVSVAPAWLGLTNRSMYVFTLWPVAYMVRQLMLARLATEREAWIRKTQAALLESLQGDLSINEVGVRTLAGAARALRAQVGALYVRRLDGSLERVASHALELEGTPERFERGEGLIGEAALGEGLRIVDELPEGFLRVQAGIGAGASRALTIAPLRSEGRTAGVIALGALAPPDPTERELLERLSEPVAIALVSADYRTRLRQLLEDTQRQAEELKTQQAELEAQQAELEATNEEMSQTNAMMEAQTQELQRQAEELERSRALAEKASRYKSEFLANMSHELRTPLNSSLILARLLADNREGNLTDEQIRSAETIHSAGNDLLVLINDILDLAKIEAGRVEVTPEPIPTARLLEGLERAFRPVAAERGLEFSIVADAALERIVSDVRRLEQVLKNLLSNAFKFTEQGGVELAVRAEGKQVRFAVRDTGIGIPPDQQAVIFEAFRQADGTTSRKYGGTGLGLSISRELARLLGGEIEVASEAGRGSTFSLVVPTELVAAPRGAAPTEEDAPAERPGLPAPRRAPEAAERTRVAPAFPDDRGALRRPGRLILAVEDDTAFARILYDLAHELDFDCVVAHTADEGIALASELSPSGLLLDVGLPDASGLSVLERLKRNPTTRHIPVHMVSVSDNVQTALELGAIGYALKPVARDELVVVLKKLQERYAREVRRVLLVEDDVRQQESIRQLLGGQGVELVVAGSVREALAELEKASFDCMVLDLTLPDGSGHDLLEKMAEGTRYSFPPVIVYTGRELERADEEKLRKYSRSIIVKGARSPERLLDEVTLFLHQVESRLPPDQRRMLASARQREAAFEGRRILIVEDDVRNVFALSRVLEPRGAKVEIARNGREAVERLKRDPDMDLVLMDLMMPEMDGLTAMREIRKQVAFKRLPIIALTAKAMADDREQALEAGANDYMPKPFEVDKLVSLCRVWLPR